MQELEASDAKYIPAWDLTGIVEQKTGICPAHRTYTKDVKRFMDASVFAAVQRLQRQRGVRLRLRCAIAHRLRHVLRPGGGGTARASAVSPEDIGGILVTHEHIDHIRGVGVFARKYRLPGATPRRSTWAAMEEKLGPIAPENRRTVRPGEDFFLGQLNVTRLSHPPRRGLQPWATRCPPRTGRVSAWPRTSAASASSWLDAVRGCAAVLLESNYDPGMLQAGRYPYDLKRRIQSRKGHLSNDDAAEAALALVHAGARQLVLGHLSKENNFPELALQCTMSALERDGAAGVQVCVARRDGNSGVFTVSAEMLE